MREQRAVPLPLIVDSERGTGSGSRVSGIAVPFGGLSEDLGFREQFDPGAFAEQHADGFPGVLAFYAHDSKFVLGSVRAGTMKIEPTRTALLYEIRLPRSAAYIRELVERGDLAGASISFSASTDHWGRLPDGSPLRTVTQAELFEVSLVASPAYAQTSAQLRGLERASSDERAALAMRARRRRLELHHLKARVAA
jgi:HK97 family phage prohead protease